MDFFSPRICPCFLVISSLGGKVVSEQLQVISAEKTVFFSFNVQRSGMSVWKKSINIFEKRRSVKFILITPHLSKKKNYLVYKNVWISKL